MSISVKKIALGFAGAAASLAAFAPLAQATPDTFSPTAGITGCPANFVYTAASSGASNKALPTNAHTAPVVGELGKQLGVRGDTTTRAVPYNAGWGTGTISYNDSVTDGANATIKLIKDDLARCPGAKVHLAGYSEGADVVGEAFERIVAGTEGISPDKVGSVVRISASSRQPDGTQAWGSAAHGYGFNPARNFGAYGNKVLEMCKGGDAVCDTMNISRPIGRVAEIVTDTTPLKFQTNQDLIAKLRADAKAQPEKVGQGLAKLPEFISGWGIHGTYNDAIAPARDFIVNHM